jgi:hypothetical protein
MAGNPVEEARVRGLITGNGLPDPPCMIDFGTNPPGSEGVYRAPIDVVQLPLNAGVQTVIHESSHVEHHHAAGLFGATYPTDLETMVGLGVLSEAFVGFRLAPIAGFLAFEHARLPWYGHTALMLIMTRYQTVTAQGPTYVYADIMTLDLYKVLLFVLPLLIAEATSNGPKPFSSQLTSTSQHPFLPATSLVLVRAIQGALRIVELAQRVSPQMVGTALCTRMTMTLVGQRLLADLRANNIYP